jgi:hypothetical protein
MYIDRMVDLVHSICASSKLSKREKSEALEEALCGILYVGEMEGIEHGDSNETFHKELLWSERKDKTIVVRKRMLQAAQRLNQILNNTRIKWDGSEVEAKHVQFIQDELDRRGIVVAN